MEEKQEDKKLFTAMIIALCIGIIIVVVTLFLTKPAKENFTELYFNDHASLPEYAQLNTSYDYSFSIHNVENKDMTYDYMTSTEYYKYDYGCERPDLYLEPTENSRITDTNDARLIIRGNYNITFTYQVYSGKGQIIFRMVDAGNNPYYAFILDQENQRATFSGDQEYQRDTIIPDSAKVNIEAINGKVRMSINDQLIFDTFLDQYTGGFPQFETINSYVEIPSVMVQKSNQRQLITIKIADAQYDTVEMQPYTDKGTVNQYPKLFAAPTYDALVNSAPIPVDKTSSTYFASPINYTSFIFRIQYSDYIGIGFENILEIEHIANTLVINGEPFNVPQKSNNDLSIKVMNNQVTILLNDAVIKQGTYDIVNPKPFVKKQPGTIIRDVYIKDTQNPAMIRYTIPDSGPKITYAPVYGTDVFNASTDAKPITNDVPILSDIFEREKLSWKNYRIVANFIDRQKKGNFSITFIGKDATYYTLTVSSSKNTAELTYMNEGNYVTETKSIKPSTLDRVIIDVGDSALSVTLNDEKIFDVKTDSFTAGIVLLDYTNVVMTKAQAEDKDSSAVKIYRRETNPECAPLLVASEQTQNSVNVFNGETQSLNNSVSFTKDFDIAKVQISLNNSQEIHFIVKNI
jgi:hypothetical protein